MLSDMLMIKTLGTLQDANINSKRYPKLEKKMLQPMKTAFWKNGLKMFKT